MTTLWRDVRVALRGFGSQPGFALTAIVSLAIGIGANATVFSVTSALLLKPLPYADQDRLAILWNRSPGLNIAEDWFSTAQYFDIKTSQRSLEQVAIAIGANDNLTGEGLTPERIGTLRVSSNLLPMLGASALHGRLLTPEDDQPGRTGVALLSHGTWLRRYGGDPRVIGRTIVLNGQPYAVAGVLDEPFTLPREVMPTLGGAEDAEIVLPLPLAAAAATTRNREDYNLLARLKPGVRLADAQAEMDVLTARLRREHPDFYPPNGGLTFSIVPLRDQVVGSVERPLLILSGAVGFVLLIACANVANLLLARAFARQKEFAVRAALGAHRGRLVRQLLTESVVLAATGGIVGIGLAYWSVPWIHALGTRSIPRLGEITLDGRVLVFTAGVSLAAGVLFGLVPARRATRVDLQTPLRDAGRGTAAAGSLWSRGNALRRALVVSELALSVILLLAAGLLVRSFARVLEVRPGFDPLNVLTLELTMTGPKYAAADAVIETYRQLWTRLEALPGVSAAGGVSALPLSQMMAWGPITVEGRTPPAGERFINVDQRVVAASYFEAMQIPLREGRLFDARDTRTVPRVVVVDEHMAAQLWPGQSAIGKRVKTGGFDAGSNWMEVIGVVGRIKQDALDADSRMAMYFAHTQLGSRAANVVVRASVDAAALTAAVREQIRQVDPDLPIYRVRTMAERVDDSLAPRRFSMTLLTAFAALALGLAAIGTYGVIAYLVNQSTREFGIRLALGAAPRRLLLSIVRHGLAIALVGIALGVGAALVLTGVIRSLLFEIESTDMTTFTLIPIVLLLVAVAASYVPARRAAGIDPSVSLRAE
jgi:predicted permease